MLTDKEVKEIRDELEHCSRPIFFFHDDPDGLASFLLLYKYVKEGKGVIVKAHPQITENIFARKVEEFEADKVFVLDIAMVDQEFIDRVKVPVIWIDHHSPMERDRVKYFNPRLKDNLNIPVAYLCYQVAKSDAWIAAAGCIGDWFLPDFINEIEEKYPDLIDGRKKVEDILFDTKFGELVKILAFNLKGKTTDAMKSVKILTRIQSPYEILNQETPRGKFIYRRYEKINKLYEELKKEALEKTKKGKILLFTYTDDKLSLTKDLANELLYMFPDKVIILGREKSGEMRCSLRSGKDIILPPMLEKALVGLQGRGGGHEHACGVSVKKEDFKQFVSNLKKELGV